MGPVRTCIGCRSRAPRSALIRLVMQNDVLTIDEAAVLPGRGAWIHPVHECLVRAEGRGTIARALRTTRSLDTAPLQNRLNG